MTLHKDHSQNARPLWLVLMLLVAPGCAYLAPGIAPIPSDPPDTASFGTLSPALIADEYEPSLDVDASDVSPETLRYASGALIPAQSGDSGRYIARQYPRVYPAPPPPSAYGLPGNGTVNPGLQPPSVYQVAPSPSAAGQLPPGFQQALPPPLTGVPQTIPTPPPMQAYPQQVPMGDYGLSPLVPLYENPAFGSGAALDPFSGMPAPPPTYIPETRTADLEITGTPARTGRLMLGGAVNSDAGVTGNITLDERNFDILRFPRSFQDLAGGTAFRGAGQTFRLEAVPGSVFKRYTASFADPNLFGYLPISFGMSAFLYDRRFRDYDEERLGGRLSLGYRVTPELSITSGLNLQNVQVGNARIPGVPQLDKVIGNNDLYTGEFRLTHDSRNSPFQPSEGHFFEIGYEKAFGEFDYSRFEIENRNYLLLTQRADESGKQTLSFSTRVGFSGADTPLFENYFAGGYSTIRGFNFRGASPVEGGVQVGGRFQWLNTLEYMFPITADDSFRGVAFTDFGTVEQDIKLRADSFRVAPGVGLRVSIPMLGPAPLAFDFAYPVTKANGDEQRIFSFYMSTLR